MQIEARAAPDAIPIFSASSAGEKRYSGQAGPKFGHHCPTRCLIFVSFEGGEGGIRTHGGVTPTPVFETGLFNRSSTSPDERTRQLFYVTEEDLPALEFFSALLFCF
jgi:hypothetical protein